MRLRLAFLLAAILAIGVATTGFAQQPGEIFGKVTDASGAVMPGVNVTLTGGSLIQPMVATSSSTGTYRFPGLGVGVYSIKFELDGFKTILRTAVRVEIGANVQINGSMEISQLQETVTVTGETPVVDLRDTSKSSRFTQEALQAIPSSRDPWTIIEQTPAVAMDRQNVGGSASGQQSNFVARGAAMTQQKWNLDGVDVTDMSATGGSPVYYDFDAFEEMQISTGGADVTMQTPGVSVNLVTKSGTDTLRGSGRLYITDQKFQSNNVTEELRQSGASSGNPIQKIRDYGVEAGGPIKKGRAWFWGSYGKQDVNVGINGFYKAGSTCEAIKADPLAYSYDEIKACLNTDQTLLNNYNAKLAVELFKNNQFSFYYNGAEKIRNARDASDLRPLETTYRQLGVTDTQYGSRFWKTGMPKTYKWGDRQIFSDRFMMEYQYAHVGNNFELALHDPSLYDVQPEYDISTGAYARSYQDIVYVRPTDSIDVTGNYFLPGVLGGDHTFKFGFKYRNDLALTSSQMGGNAIARFENFLDWVPSEVNIYRNGLSEGGLHNRSVYAQDTFSRKRLTLVLGLRFDYQTDYQNGENVPATPFYGEATFAGVYDGDTYTGQPFNQLPALTTSRVDSGVTWKTFNPRMGLTYDLTGNGKNVVKVNYARYVGQLGTGELSSYYTNTGSKMVRYPWVDLNGDRVVQADEVVLTANPLTWSSGYNYRDPSNIATTATVDPNLKPDVTNEIIVGFDKQIGSDVGISASYIYRKYTSFYWSDRTNWTSANYESKTYTPTCTVADARCESITYYQPTSQIPTNFLVTNQPDYYRAYNGVEVSIRKRMSHRWMMNGGFSYNNAPRYYESDAAYEDPTNIDKLNGGQYAPESTSSGLGNVFVNAKWIFRLSGAYQLPFYGINVAGFYNARQGYPFTATIYTPTRPYSAGRTDVYLDEMGSNRLPNFQSLDFRIDKVVPVNRARITLGLDVFNLMNGNTSLSIRGRQNANNANQISAILAPRVLRFGLRVTF